MNDKLLNFIKFTSLFRSIERSILVNNDTRAENDMEHSYQLALVGWYIVQTRKLPLNIDLVMKYALIHDIFEAYSGDTCVFLNEQSYVDTKEEREKAAIEKLKEDFKEFSEMNDLLDKYESFEDEESKFVYALDKLIPTLNIKVDKSHRHQDKKITFDDWYTKKGYKVEKSKYVLEIFEELKEIMQKDELLFYKEK